jgi:protoporphyrinogen oxidase/peptidoglycan/xylan/chitin deacetylase (PgdA/CDA1 family)
VTAQRYVVVGGGMLGLTVALRLRQQGHQVTVLEAAPHLGGLASAWRLEDVVWDRHYHVTLLSDTWVRDLLRELHLEYEMEWVETRTGVYSDGRLYSVSNGLEFLRFPPLPLIDKFRLGATIVYGSKVRDWRRLEQVPVDRWLTRLSGRRTFERFWLPLLKAKLGDGYRQANAAFIWATIQRLYAARRTGLKKEMFGYVPGGYARILERFAQVLDGQGVEVVLDAGVSSIAHTDGEVVVRDRRGGERHADHVVVTANASVAARVIEGLSDTERAVLEGVEYQGIVCASVLLRRPLSPYYLTYITDDAPFTAVVEMSAFVDPSQFGGHTLVYLPKYCRADDPVAHLSDEEIEHRFLDGLQAMYPDLSRDDVLAFRVSRVREVFALPTLGYSQRVPPTRTSVPGVHVVTSAQIVNGTLNVNETVRLAERAVTGLLAAATSGTPGTDPLVPAARITTRARRSSAESPDTTRPTHPTRPTATLSIDLDNLWSYLKTNGDPAWRGFPSFLDVVVPRLLHLLEDREQLTTWFVVGQDAAMPEHGDLLRSVVAAGHEVANHSFLHEPWMHRYPVAAIDDELARTEKAIEDATGVRPTGFRGPGYSLSPEVLMALQARGYRYDASTLPTWIGPLARAYYLRGSELDPREREEREALFGGFGDGRRPLAPYRWSLPGGDLVEVPVTTMPGLRTPIHLSYLVYLAELSPAAARTYLRTALAACRRAGVAPSLLVHSHDVLGGDDVPSMRFFPGFKLPGRQKRQFVASCIDLLRDGFEVVPMASFVDQLGPLPRRPPRFSGLSEDRIEPTDPPTGGEPR